MCMYIPVRWNIVIKYVSMDVAVYEVKHIFLKACCCFIHHYTHRAVLCYLYVYIIIAGGAKEWRDVQWPSCQL